MNAKQSNHGNNCNDGGDHRLTKRKGLHRYPFGKTNVEIFCYFGQEFQVLMVHISSVAFDGK
jgi:hypothetical protein